MRILYVKTGVLQECDIDEALQSLNLTVHVLEIGKQIRYQMNEKMIDLLNVSYEQNEFDVVFSMGFDISIAEFCDQKHIQYLSWVCESPNLELFHKNAKYQGNKIFIYDKEILKTFQNVGLTNVNYLPLGVNLRRLQRIKKSVTSHGMVKQPLTYVGNFHVAEANDYKALSQAMDPYVTGYLEAMIQAQRNVPKHNIIEAAISDKVIQMMKERIPCGNEVDSSVSAAYIYLNYFLYPRITMMERLQALLLLSKQVSVGVCTKDSSLKIGNCINFGYADYENEVPAVICNSKINLNLTSRTSPSGISQHLLNVMGCGEFLITDYRQEIAEIFEPGKEIVIYDCNEELTDKVTFYLKHDQERERIASNAYQTIEKSYDYVTRLKSIFEIK